MFAILFRKKIIIPFVVAMISLTVPFSAMAQSIQSPNVVESGSIEKVIGGKSFTISSNSIGKVTDEELLAISQQATGTGEIYINNVIDNF